MTDQALPIPAGQSERWNAFERRARIRYPSCLNTFCWITESAERDECPGWIRDFSVNGIGLVLEERFAPGATLTIELINPKRRFRRKLHGRVTANIAELANEGWLHGLVLTRELHADEVQALLP